MAALFRSPRRRKMCVMSQPSEPHRPISIARILLLVVPVAIMAVAAYVWSRQLEITAREQSAPNTIARMFTAEATELSGPLKFPDQEKDDVADPPQDEAALISPDTLVFSFVAGGGEGVGARKTQEKFFEP